MRMTKPKGLVLYGLGLNTDYESERALMLAGFDPTRIHINKLIDNSRILDDTRLLVVPGGFAHGDILGAGKIFAFTLKRKLSEELYRFIKDGKLVFGACNGLQILVKSGLLPAFDGQYDNQTVTLAPNDSRRFEDRWTYLEANRDSPCVFTKGIDDLYFCVRHGEGKLMVQDKQTYDRLLSGNHIALWYTDQHGERNPPYPLNPNGSLDGIAGICDETGRVLGMMPHPEAYTHRTNHPRWTRTGEIIPSEPLGLRLFRNAANYLS
jgi:phosphoribosylformylglycinamidine synthase